MATKEMEIIITLKDKFTKGMKNVSSQMQTIGDRARNVSGMVFNLKAALLGLGAGIVVNSIVKTKNEFVKYQKTLETLEGSIGKANAKWAEMLQFAEETPFSIAQVMESYKTLRAFGLEPTVEMMTTLGDTAAALGGSDVLGRIALVLGQIRAQGFMTAQDMNQLANAGINAGEVMFKTFGVARDQVAKLRDQGVTANDIITALLDNMKSTFGGQMAAMNKELSGQWEMLISIWERFTVKIMDSGIYDYINKVLTGINDKIIELRESGKLDEWAESISTKVINAFEKMVIGIADAYDILAPIMLNFGKVFSAIWDWFKSLPTWVQTAGIAVAIMGGTSAKVAVVMLAELYKAGERFYVLFKELGRKAIGSGSAIENLTTEIAFLEQELKFKDWNFLEPEEVESYTKRLVMLKAELRKLQDQGAKGVGLDEIKIDESMGVKARKGLAALKEVATETSATVKYAAEDVGKMLTQVFNDAEFEDIKSRIKALADTSGKAAIEMTKGMKETIDSFIKQAAKLYQAAKEEAESYAAKVIEVEATIRSIRMSTADKIRDLQRQLMTDEKAYADEQLQAAQKLSGAKSALAQGDLNLARSLAQEAESLYAGLAREVTKDIGGQSIISQSLATSVAIATQGIQQVGSFSVQVEEKQKSMYQALENEAIKRMEVIKKKMDELAVARIANIEIKLTEVEAAQNAINKLIADETKHISIKVTKTIVTAEDSGAETEGRQRGGIFPGYGGGDKINVLAEAGEGFVRKEAIRKYGRSFFNAYNSLALPINQATRFLKARIGGIIAPDLTSFQQKFQAGGLVAQPSFKSLGTIDLKVGSHSYPVLGSISVLEELKTAIKREGMLRSNG